MTTVNLTEAVTLTEATASTGAPAGRKFRARLIAGDVQGSSGYYPAAVLKRDGPKVFTAGLPTYIDHPTVSEAFERPERSVRDMAGRLASDAVYQGDGLYADVEVFPHMAPVIEAMADAIGMSIRARGTAEQGGPDGTAGPQITSLTEASSVDFVTKAGAGGKLVALLESAQAPATLAEAGSIGVWLESRLHSLFTELADDMYGYGQLTRDERISLSGAVGSALDAFTGGIESTAPQLYARDRWGDPATAPNQPTPVTADEATTPVTPTAGIVDAMRRVHEAATKTSTTQGDGTPPAATTTTEGSPEMGDTKTGTPPVEPGGTGITEAATSQPVVLGEAAQLNQYLIEARRAQAEAIAAQEAAETRAQHAEHRALVVEAQHSAEKQVRASLAGSPLTEASHQGVVDAVCNSLSVDEAGKVDPAKLTEAITAEIDRARRHEASILEAHGAGIPKGLGVTGDPHPMTDADFEATVTESFKRLGLDDKAASIAAKGR